MKILLLGAPGSGKGTLSEYLVKQHKFVHVSTGDIFRKTIELNLEFANELKSYMLKGDLVPDDLTNKIVKNYLQDLVKQNHSIVLDGYPRTIEQAEFLNNILELDKVFYLDVNHEILEKRLTGRRTCSVCKKIYNIYFSPPKVDGICDLDNGLLTQRKDDEINTIQNRLSVYKKTTAPLIDYYKSKNKLVTIEASDSPSKVNQEIESYLK